MAIYGGWFLLTVDGNTERVTRAWLMAVLDARGMDRWARKQALAESYNGQQVVRDGLSFRRTC